MPTNEPELTEAARRAVRGYVLFLVGLPSLAISLGMFFLGYFVKDVAQERAFNEAFKTISARYTDLLTQMAQDRSLAQSARIQIDEDRTKVEQIRKSLESVQVLTTAASRIDEIATTIRNDPAFKKRMESAFVQFDTPVQIVTGPKPSGAALTNDVPHVQMPRTGLDRQQWLIAPVNK